MKDSKALEIKNQSLLFLNSKISNNIKKILNLPIKRYALEKSSAFMAFISLQNNLREIIPRV